MLSTWIALVVLAPVCAIGASDAGPVVEDIQIKNMGAGHLDESFVRTHIDAETGANLDRAGVSRDVKALLDTGRFSYVGVSIEPLKEGVRLIYSLRNKLRLTAPPEVTGSDHLSASKVADLLELKEGDLVDDAALGVAAQKVIKRYHDDFYPQAGVTWDIQETDSAEGLCKARIKVNEGRRAYVAAVKFVGNEHVEPAELRSTAGQRSPWNPIEWFSFWKREYNPDEIETARLAIRDLYMNRGFLDVEVGAPKAEAREDGNMVVSFEVREGKTYRVGGITLGGINLFPELELSGLARIKRGDVASYALIRDSGEAMREYYTSRGYLDTMVKWELKPDKASSVVDVHFQVKEGILTRIGNIAIRGNTRTKDKVIRRELQVYPGDIYNETRVRRSESRLMNLGYFSSVRGHPTGGEVPDIRDMVFEVEEQRTGQFMTGVGFSSVENLMGYVEVTQGNFDINGWPYFTGDGQKARASAQFGKITRRYELSFVEPWFMDRRLLLGVDLYISDVKYTDYDVDRTGGAIRLGKSLPWDSRAELVYRLENVVVKNVSDTNVYAVVNTGEDYSFVRDEDLMESSMKLTLSHDTRNNPFFPTRGTLVSVFGRVSGGLLGFDTDIYGFGLTGSRYVPLWYNHVLSFLVRGEVVDTYGDTEDVPISDRLFMGGGRTLRGFKYRDVGPKVEHKNPAPDDDWHRPIGGDSLAMASAEYNVPIIKQIRLAAFYDIGNLWADPFYFDFSEMASSWGIGIRFDIPGFPMRFDYAWPLKKDDPLTDTERFSFGIGYGY